MLAFMQKIFFHLQEYEITAIYVSTSDSVLRTAYSTLNSTATTREQESPRL